jgi:UDP-N-acetylglucosamine 1-carboxyvinyltransferase
MFKTFMSMQRKKGLSIFSSFYRKKRVKKVFMANSFEVTGGLELSGELVPQGAKNEALQILCAVLLTPEKMVIRNIPDIRDVNKLIELLQHLGVEVEQTGVLKGEFTFHAKNIKIDYLDTPEFKKQASELRGSIMIVGPLLARYGKARIPKPGGDKIGRRRLDTHFVGFQNLGAQFEYNEQDGFYNVTAKKLKGTYMLLDEASVTGTANIVMAAVLAEGTTTIYNAACEPYLQQLCNMLNRMGAKISGIGSNLLVIEGVSSLRGTEHKLLPDMIEIGSFIGLAAMTKSEITIKEVGYQHLGIIPEMFRRLGIQMELRGDDLYIPRQENYEIESFIDGSILTVADAIWPGFTPDLLSVVLVTATQANGTVLIHQKMFESRLFFVDKLIDMGAQIILCDPHRATVIGLNRKVPLKAIQMTSPDIRAGVALLIAALSAKGKSVIHNIEQIDRGYQRIDERLNAIGAKIVRV